MAQAEGTYDEAQIRAEYADLTRELIARGLQVSTMESATSGQIASLITDTEGASAVLRGAYVTYCNEAKVKCGVPADVIRAHTVYSTQTAEAMAQACRRSYAANIGIGVTGTMGNVDGREEPQLPRAPRSAAVAAHVQARGCEGGPGQAGGPSRRGGGVAAGRRLACAPRGQGG